jgi:insulin-like growth factor-binding protein complex acid labile subunit
MLNEQVDFKGVFKYRASLTILAILDFKDLHRIHRETFEGLVDIEEIHLSNCSICEIEPGAFSYLQKLRKLDLSFNQLTNFPPIEDLSNLECLNLEFNKISSLDGVFTQPKLMSNLKLIMLNLKFNKLYILPANSFSNLTSLRALDLSYNILNEISNEAFAGLVNLRHLNLCNANCKVISSGLFSTTPNLDHLVLIRLMFCLKLESIDEGAFSHFRKQLRVSMPHYADNHGIFTPFESKGLISIDFCD